MSKWTLIAFAVGGGAGLVGALLARLFIRDPGRKTLRNGITVVVMVIATQLTNEFVVKPAKLDAEICEVEVMRVLRERDPEAYAAIRADVMAVVRKGGDEAAIGAAVGQRVWPLAQKYIPRASDEALRHFISATVAAIDQLRLKDPELARQFLFPPEGQFFDVRGHLDAAQMQEMNSAFGELVETGSGAAPHEDDAQRTDELLAGVIARLKLTHGDDLALLTRPTAPDTDAARLTAVAADLYREILKLPAPDSGLVLRKMLSPS